MIPAEASYLNWQGAGLALTGFKRSDAGADVIVRFVNVTDEPVTLQMDKMPWMTGAYISNVLEEKKDALEVSGDGRYDKVIAPFEIATFGFEC